MKFVNPMLKVTCPCGHRFHPALADTLLPNNGTFTPDPRLYRYYNLKNRSLGIIQARSKRNAFRRMVDRICLDDSWLDTEAMKACPICGNFLTLQSAKGESAAEAIACVGIRNSGKSVYLGVLLHAMDHRFQNEVGFSIQDLETIHPDDNCVRIGSREMCRRMYAERLFPADGGAPMLPDPTKPGKVRIPLLYRYYFSSRIRRNSIAHAVDLIVRDEAGEALTDPEMFRQYCHYVKGLNGCILLIDTTTLPGVRSLLPPAIAARLAGTNGETTARNSAENPAEIISRTIDAFPRLSARAKIPMRVAVTLSKIDVLEHTKLLGPDSLLRRDSLHDGGYNVRDGQAVSREIERILKEVGAGEIIRQVRDKFHSFQLFGVSALGGVPGVVGPGQFRPRRVADPLLWLLWKGSYLRAMRY